MISLALGIIERGLIFSLIVIAVYLSSVILKFDDLTLKGSFSLGGAITAFCFLAGFNFIAALTLAIIGGGLCGFVTGMLHTKTGVNNLISGLVVTTAIFSINLKLCSSLPTVALDEALTIFNIVPLALNIEKTLIILIPLVCSVLIFLQWFLKTEIGFLIYAVGDNPQLLYNIGNSPDFYLILTLMISNAICGLAGSLLVQYMGNFFVMGHFGITTLALGSLILARIINTNFNFVLVLAAIIYQCIIAMSFEFHYDQDLNQLLYAFLVVLLILIMKYIKKAQIW
jgi:putative ABC transport system permease protein